MPRMHSSDRRRGGSDTLDPGEAATRVGTALAQQAAREMAEPLAGGLYVVATPIGNLGDMTVRAVTTLARADAILCEDTRVSRTLLERYAIERPLRAFHEHNEDAEQARVLAEIAGGQAIALISDAGTPLLSDPGFKLVRAAIAAGHPVTALPGASAILTGLALSGLPTDGFFFGGFLPNKQAARRTRLEALAAIPGSIVLFESPSRIADALADVAAVLGDREVVVARELTKRFEEVRRGLAAVLAAELDAHPIKGEIVLVIAPAPPREVSDAEIESALRSALATSSLRDAVRLVTDDLGAARSRVYQTGLRLKDEA
ncbi:MAG TPA: 16S rRNA (cytidine(1402)-2'-O)-methyltransferase [Hyphomicrobiaceae bacterium]|nr:16S rRNA (cytidine(1402)-2'-O)-methyltransferase [Hyphomicrobiaceae bacterium]